MESDQRQAEASGTTTRKPFDWRPTIVIAVLGCLVGGWFAWDGHFKDHVFPKRLATVHEGSIYRSGELTDTLVERTWRDKGIDVVVNLGRDKPGRPNHIAAQDAATNLGIDRQLFNLNGDGTGKPEVFADAIARVRTAQLAGDTTMVHCKAGQHRTGALIAMYRMLYDGWSGDEALAELMSFDVQQPQTIVDYINERLPEICAYLIEREALDAMPAPLPVVPSPTDGA